MKPDELMEVPGLIEQEDDWWDAGLCYIPNENLTRCSTTRCMEGGSSA